ncbi:MAG: aminotransferase class III-fold pyridoxal phosphate-dependent enzyme, partial [Vicingaceae bacterium]
RRFNEMKEKYACIGEVRGIGAMLAIALVKESNAWLPDEELCRNVIDGCSKRGLILLSAGTYKNIIRILSPLTISDELLNKGLDILDEELTRLTL